MCPKQLEYSSEICDQTGCHLNTKPIGVESCMAHVCYNAADVAVAIFKFLLKNNLVGHKTKLVGHVPECAPPGYATGHPLSNYKDPSKSWSRVARPLFFFYIGSGK